MKMTKQPYAIVWDDDTPNPHTQELGMLITVPNTDGSNCQGNCDRCGTLILRFRGQGDLTCHNCGANYNCFGQRLRDDLYTRVNYSEYDDDIGDMEGNEASYHDC